MTVDFLRNVNSQQAKNEVCLRSTVFAWQMAMALPHVCVLPSRNADRDSQEKRTAEQQNSGTLA